MKRYIKGNIEVEKVVNKDFSTLRLGRNPDIKLHVNKNYEGTRILLIV